MKKNKKPQSNESPPDGWFRKIAQNRKARHLYHIEETLEAGIELRGSEVKSLRTQNIDFADCYARIDNGECWIIGLRITPYDKTHVQAPDPSRKRKLLVSKSEVRNLQKSTERTGTTIIPLEIYFKGSWAKIKLGLCKGKSHSDKRAAKKEADIKRELDKTLKNARR